MAATVAGHHVPEAARAEAAPRPSETAAANVQPLLDGVRSRVAELRQDGQVTVQLQLSPPDLGHMRVQLVAHDQQVDVRLVVQTDAARHAMIGQGDTLRERLGTLGIALGRFDVRQDGGGSPAPQEQPTPKRSVTAPVGSRRGTSRRSATQIVAAPGGIDVMA